MSKGREIHCYDYVNHPYEQVCAALSKNAPAVFQSAFEFRSRTFAQVLTSRLVSALPRRRRVSRAGPPDPLSNGFVPGLASVPGGRKYLANSSTEARAFFSKLCAKPEISMWKSSALEKNFWR